MDNILISEIFLEAASRGGEPEAEREEEGSCHPPTQIPGLTPFRFLPISLLPLSPRLPTALRYSWKSTTASVSKTQTSASRIRMQQQLFWRLTPSRGPCRTPLCLLSVSSTGIKGKVWGGRCHLRAERTRHSLQCAALYLSGLVRSELFSEGM